MIGSRIFLALTQPEERKKIKVFLTRQGFTVVDETADGTNALRRIRAVHPDLIVADADLPGLSGMKLAEIVEEEDIAPIIVVTNSDKDGLWLDFEHPTGIVFLQRPLTRQGLLQTVQLSLISSYRIKHLKEDIKKLQHQLEERKLVERAKGILMEKNRLTEQEAYRLLQKQSMNTGTPLAELAKAIILSRDITG
ncbi:MAG TPA: ANTAR domain-containing protein [Clostridia bacterium]|nr:ANTAR domain-containing protein [Clostridia bacterium]